MPDAQANLADAAAAVQAALGRCHDAASDSEAGRRLVADLDLLRARASAPDCPLLVVLGGSTGVGTSTLLNTLLGRPVSPVGVLRPTTRVPLLVHRTDEQEAAGMGPLLAPALDVVTDDAVPAGVALLDSPGVDSVDRRARAQAAALVARADGWLAVTSAARYADAAGWPQLVSSDEHRVPTAVVLNRVPDRAREPVAHHLAALLGRHGLADCPLVVVGDHPVAGGMLPREAVDPMRALLSTLGQDRSVRDLARRSTLVRSVDGVVRQARAWSASQPAGAERREDVRSAVDLLRTTAAKELA